jgi:predicted porin
LEKLSMKKSLIALAALAAFGTASAQSTVIVSGGVVLGVGMTETDTTSTGPQIVRQTGNIAFKGTEDLGGGLKANFEVQTSIGAVAATSLNVNGAAAGATTLGDRGMYANVQGGFGTVTVGRTASAIRALFGAIGDVSRIAVAANGLSAGNSVGSSNAAGGDAGAFAIYGDAYVNNVSYVSPTMNGFSNQRHHVLHPAVHQRSFGRCLQHH